MSGGRLSGWLGALCCAALGLTMLQATPVAFGQRRASGAVEARQQVILGTVVGVGGRFGGRTAPFRLNVNRYTTADEVQQLNAALQSGGQNELLRVLSRMDSGRIAIGNGVGVDANAIISVPHENGTKLIVLAGGREAEYPAVVAVVTFEVALLMPGVYCGFDPL